MYNHVNYVHTLLPPLHVAKQSKKGHIIRSQGTLVNRYYAQYCDLLQEDQQCASYCRCATTTSVDHETQLVMSVD